MVGRKILCIVLAITALLCVFTGCNSKDKASGVPERYIRMDVEDLIYEEEIEEGYTFTATHSYDKSSNIDRVTIDVKISYEYGTGTITGTCNYQYDKSGDNWTRMGEVRWSEEKESLNEKSYEKKHSGTTISTDWEIEISDLDLQKGTITCAVTLINSSGSVFRTEGFRTYHFDGGSFELDVVGVTYYVHLSVRGISVLRDW